jgi:hypothetical protein
MYFVAFSAEKPASTRGSETPEIVEHQVNVGGEQSLKTRTRKWGRQR